MKTQTKKRLLDAFSACQAKELEAQFEETAKLEKQIRQNLERIDYGE
jgi:hypothetical protein